MVAPSRRTIAMVAGALALVVLGGRAYVLRDRLVPQPVTGADAASNSGVASTSNQTPAVARAPITIPTHRQQLIGVRLASATKGSLAATIRTTGAVRYDERRMADVNVKLDGWIRDLYVDYTGQPIQRGQPLFMLYSPDLLATQNEYLLALKTRDQLKESPVTDAREYAERLADAAKQRLTLWDLPPEEIAALEETRRPREAITFRSPASGYVIEKQALKGMRVMAGQTLYKIADLSIVWVEADVYEQDMARARVGQRATVTLDAYPGESFSGQAIYIYPFVEPNTRTVKVRFQFANRGGRLKPGMFANVELHGAAGTGLTVPTDALLDSGTEQVVFVAEGEGYFSPRPVKVGRRLPDRVEIVEGLKEGEQVAVGATFFLDSESQLRAGLRNYESPPVSAGSTAAPDFGLSISFSSQPDPPRTGESVFEVTVKDASGAPVADADVLVQLFMPAMPTMNMPAMRNEAKLPHVGGGVYRGPALVMTAGRWDVTVTVTRNGRRVATKQFALAAK